MRTVLLVTLLSAPWSLAQDANWSVVLTELGDKKISVIKVVREHTGLGLKDTKDLVEAPKPKVMQEGLTKAQAEAFVVELETWGAKAEAKQKGAHGPAHPPRENVAASTAIEFEVRLDDAGANKINVIKALRALTGLGLAESKKLVESTPVVINTSAPRELAEKMSSELIAAGAKVTLAPKSAALKRQ
jgi:large subunit ribosomal protein L7/L12